MQGALTGRGMPKYEEILQPGESKAIRAYIIQQAWRAKRLQPSP